MDDSKYLVAVASSDGIVINKHFGKASRFYIYNVKDDEEITLSEIRDVTPVCNAGDHDDNRLQENLNLFRDCEYVLVSRIGYGASQMADSMGIEVMELPGEIHKSITTLIQHRKINQLLGGRLK